MQIVKQVGCCTICPVAEINWEAGFLDCKVRDDYIAITQDFDPDSQVYQFCPWRMDPETTLKIEIIV